MEVCVRTVLLGVMFLLEGAVGQSVNYPDPVCAVKGSTVTLLCSFTPLHSVLDRGRNISVEVIRVVWCQNHLICHGSTPSVYDSDLKVPSRYRYLGDKKGNCTLQITDLQETDEAVLRFRMETNIPLANFAGQKGVRVTVRDRVPLTIKSSSSTELKKGEAVTLTCTATCTFHHLDVTWLKDGQALPETGPVLLLDALTAKDSGNYTCGLKTTFNSFSQPYSLNVEAKEEEEGGGSGEMSLIVGVAFAVLLALLTLILVLCIIKRRRAAEKDHPAVRGKVEQKPPDDLHCDVLTSAEQQEPEAEVCYASVQCRDKNQTRVVVEPEEGVLYSSIVSRG